MSNTGKSDYLAALKLARLGHYHEAEPLLRKSAAQKFGPAFYAIANWHIHGVVYSKDKRKAYTFLKKSAQYGFSGAHYDLAVCYETGQGTSRNLSKAAYHYKLSADSHDQMAYSEVARIYYWGIGTKVDMKTARKYYYKSACNGSIESAVYLAEMYAFGVGGRRHHIGAMCWLKKIQLLSRNLDKRSKKWWSKTGQQRVKQLKKSFLQKSRADTN